ncbi:hypothetical protein KM043_002228 [Ampulex compressa]|nr:hypothetical protein KM043_002228 [Ampulex compressa]
MGQPRMAGYVLRGELERGAKQEEKRGGRGGAVHQPHKAGTPVCSSLHCWLAISAAIPSCEHVVSARHIAETPQTRGGGNPAARCSPDDEPPHPLACISGNYAKQRVPISVTALDQTGVPIGTCRGLPRF